MITRSDILMLCGKLADELDKEDMQRQAAGVMYVCGDIDRRILKGDSPNKAISWVLMAAAKTLSELLASKDKDTNTNGIIKALKMLINEMD
jgi:hypothetical protein